MVGKVDYRVLFTTPCFRTIHVQPFSDLLWSTSGLWLVLAVKGTSSFFPFKTFFAEVPMGENIYSESETRPWVWPSDSVAWRYVIECCVHHIVHVYILHLVEIWVFIKKKLAAPICEFRQMLCFNMLLLDSLSDAADVNGSFLSCIMLRW